MSTYKQDRAAEDIKRELAAVIRELKDPRIAEHLISVSRAEVTAKLLPPDLNFSMYSI